MKRVIVLLLCIAMVFALVAGCDNKETTQTTGTTGTTAPGEKDFSGRTFETLLSVGGGGNYWEPVLARLQELYPGLTINHSYESSAGDILRTRVLANNAPDIFNINSGELPPYEAISQGIVQPIDDILKLKTMDDSSTLEDILDMSIFTLGEVDGKHYIFHEMLYLSGLWYDENYFKTNNLTVPESWEDMMELGEQADALGVDLFGFCGMMSHEYPTNYWWWPMVATTDYATYSALQNLDYEAFKGDGMQKVVDKMLEIRDKGYFNEATLGLGNAETQMSHIAHDFLLLPCGSWLEAEMADAWTDDWELGYLPYSTGTNAGDDQYMLVIGLASMISKSTENYDIAGEFYRLFYSDEASIRGAVGVHHNAMAIDGFADKYGDLLDPSVKKIVGALNEKMTGINNPANRWYPTINPEIGNMIVGLMGGTLTGEQFMQRGYDLFKGLADDTEITKYTFSG